MLKRIIGKKKILMLMLGIIVGILISVVGVYAATLIDSKNVTYDNSKSKLESTNVQDAIDELHSKLNITLVSYVIDLYTKSLNKNKVTIGDNSIGTETIIQATDNNVMKDSHGNIRYYGKSPNNYVKFNDELWRIIGVSNFLASNNFENMQIKLIKDDPFPEEIPFDKNGSNNWPTSSLQNYLNGEYYNSLNDDKLMIDEAIWYLGGIAYAGSEFLNNYPNILYNKERGTEVYQNNSKTWPGKIGLIYLSDYGYATDLSQCNQKIGNYNDNICVSNNWLVNSKYHRWSITPDSTRPNFIYTIYKAGNNSLNSVDLSTINVDPVLYLKPNIIITGGTGEKDNPYTLKLINDK